MRNLSYLESEEPDELSQANALNAIDKLLSLEEINDYTTNPLYENYTNPKISENMKNSGPNLSAKVAKYLAKSNKIDNNNYLVRKMGVFDWVNSDDEEREREREGEREDCISYDVGPMTQMAAEAIQELFNAPHISPIEKNNDFTKRKREIETDKNEKEFSVFTHPKKRRSNVRRKNIIINNNNNNNNRLPLIFDNVKRKKRSPLIRGKICKFGAVRKVKCEERDIKGKLKLRERNEGLVSKKVFCYVRRPKRSMKEIRVLFSQNLDPKIVKQQKKILARFKAPTVQSAIEATHFVADRFARTKNMLESIAMGRHVATPDWLESCNEKGCFVSEQNFILRDLKKEREIGFCMVDSIRIAKENPLLEGWRVMVTQKVRPNKELIKCLVKAANGQLVERISRYIIHDEKYLQGNFFIISCKEDYRICLPLLKIGIKVYDSELLLNAIVIQKLEFERHRLFAAKS